MNIAFLCRLWPIYGGGETVTLMLANEMINRGCNVCIFYTEERVSSDMPYIDSRLVSIKLEDINVNEFNDFSKSDIVKANLFLKAQINKHNIDVIINQWWPCTALKGMKQQVKIIKCLHTTLFRSSNYDYLGFRGKDLIKRLLGRTFIDFLYKKIACNQVDKDLKYVHRYVFLSKYYEEDFLSFKNIKKHPQIISINNPSSNISEFTKDDLLKKRKIVLCVARLSESSKKISHMIKIWANIEKDNRFNDWTFEIVGDGPSLQLYKNLTKELNIKRVTFHGRQNPTSYYKKSKIFLMTSIIEGWGMTLIEAQQFGVVPIVSDTFSSLHEIITDKVNGRIVPKHEMALYESILKEVMMDSSQLNIMACNAILSVKKFSIERIVDKWLRVIDEIKI